MHEHVHVAQYPILSAMCLIHITFPFTNDYLVEATGRHLLLLTILVLFQSNNKSKAIVRVRNAYYIVEKNHRYKVSIHAHHFATTVNYIRNG